VSPVAATITRYTQPIQNLNKCKPAHQIREEAAERVAQAERPERRSLRGLLAIMLTIGILIGFEAGC